MKAVFGVLKDVHMLIAQWIHYLKYKYIVSHFLRGMYKKYI